MEAVQTGATSGATTAGPKRKKMKWAFALCPVMDYGPKHILLSSTAIKELFKQVAGMTKENGQSAHPHIKNLYDSVQAEEKGLGEDAPEHERNALYWYALFNLGKSLRRKFKRNPELLRFGNFIATDGVGVSLTILKRKSKVQLELLDLDRKIQAQTKHLKEANTPPELAQKLEKLQGRLESAKDDATKKEANKEIKELKKVIAKRIKPTLDTDGQLGSLKAAKKAIQDMQEMMGDKYKVSPELKAKLAPQLEEVDGEIIFKPGKMKSRGIDPGKNALGTFAEQSSEAGHKHVHGAMKAGEWIFISGQKQYTKKRTRRIKENCPEWLECPSLKTEVEADLFAAIEYRIRLLPKMDELLFHELWSQKQRMRKFVKRQSALETVVARFCGTANKVEQKENVVIALGDADLRANIRGKPPIMSAIWVKHMMRSTTVVLVNEFRTSMLCSKCHRVMLQLRKCFGVKRCTNSVCSRGFWNRDVNAAINILNLFLWAVAFGKPETKGCCSGTSKSRPEVFRRTER